ncbi:sodium channel protein Nach-like [Armigeres subalbatus]|uniref:sodium channel protein Nach-like n=1 Tax=Armigeres subalbatus TaxID=124917 RepID=UPI002ED2AA55
MVEATKSNHLQFLERTDSVMECVRSRFPASGHETSRRKLIAALGIESVQYMFDQRKHPIERIFWIVITGWAIYGAIFIGMYQLDRFYANPTVMQFDKNYREWIGTMPAATFCFRNRFDRAKAIEYIHRNNLSRTGDTERIERILTLFQTLVNLTVSDFNPLASFVANDSNYTHNSPSLFMSALLSNVDILSVVSAVHPHVDVAINSFDPAYNDLPIKQVITERGICYTLNAPLSRLQYIPKGSHNIDIHEDMPNEPITCAYSKNQCYMKIDTFESTMSYLLHSPYELATSEEQFAVMSETDELVSSYVVVETVASDRLRYLSVKQRNCVFRDENYQEAEIYSYNLCIMRCRASKALEFCRCKPHFYPFVDAPVCTIDGLRCLEKHPSWYDKQSCRCLKPCTDVVYYVAGSNINHWSPEEGIPFKQKASFRWEMVQPKTRQRRDVLFTFEDLLVSFGGAISLFVGKDVLAFAELPIFLTTEAIQRVIVLIRGKKQ